MKKKFAKVTGMLTAVMTAALLMPLTQGAWEAYAAEEENVSEETGAAGRDGLEEADSTAEKRLMKTISLDSNETTQVPRYIAEGNAVYELDESSIVVEATERGSSEGADVVLFSEKVEDLPDNDLERLEKETVREGIHYELLSVVYKVEEEDEDGIPVRYSALCEYGGLRKYRNSYPTAWQLTAWYDFCEPSAVTTVVTEEREHEIISDREVQDIRRIGSSVMESKETKREEPGALEEKKEEPELPQKPEVKKIVIKPEAEEKKKEIGDGLVPLAAAAAGAGVALPFIIWFSILTAPLFTLKQEGKYRYIGQIRLKRKEDVYTAHLTARLFGRADLPVFRIKLPGKVWKKAKAGVFQVCCPDKKKIVLTAGRTVRFTVERD